METELLELLGTYSNEIPHREYQCLKTLIEEGDIKSYEDLAVYGIERRYSTA